MPHISTPERRRDTRRQVAPGDDVRFEVTVPFPKGITIAKKVIDIGNTGLSFYLDGNEGYMLPGTPLGECIVVDGHRKFKTAGEVVYSESIKNGEYHRIGVRFTADLRKQSLALYRQLGHHLRPSRYAAEEIAPLRLDVVLTDHSNMLVGVAVDFSRYGFAVGIPLSGARVVPRAIMEIVVRAGNRVVHTGSAVVAHVTTSSTVMLVGLELTDNLLNLKELECEKRCVILASQATALVEQMDHQKSLSPQFRAEIADLRSLLEQLKSLLDTVEHDLEETPEFSVLPNAFIDVIDREVVGSINASLKAIASLVGALGPKDHDRYRKHFQDALHPLLLESPFFARTFRKPLGYAGDFEMVN
ncbi:MAG: PilZ domain-containing protein, partial [Nitrospiria bacterium]